MAMEACGACKVPSRKTLAVLGISLDVLVYALGFKL